MKIYHVIRINTHQGFFDEHEYYFGPKEVVVRNRFEGEVWYAKKDPHFSDTIELRAYESEKPLSELTEEDIIKMMCYGYTTEDSYAK